MSGCSPVTRRRPAVGCRRAAASLPGATSNGELQAQLDAIRRVQAVIEFDLEGKILWANDNFLNTLGYSLLDIQGRHHSMFVESAYASSTEYQEFWRSIRSFVPAWDAAIDEFNGRTGVLNA